MVAGSTPPVSTPPAQTWQPVKGRVPAMGSSTCFAFRARARAFSSAFFPADSCGDNPARPRSQVTSFGAARYPKAFAAGRSPARARAHAESSTRNGVQLHARHVVEFVRLVETHVVPGAYRHIPPDDEMRTCVLGVHAIIYHDGMQPALPHRDALGAQSQPKTPVPSR